MSTTSRILAFAFALACALAGCARPGHSDDIGAARPPAAPSPTPPPTPPREPLHAGWYMERSDATDTFHPCGADAAVLVGSAELRARARAFGLGRDTPVYVRVRGNIAGSLLQVADVEQFGSPTPVADCGMGPGATAAQ